MFYALVLLMIVNGQPLLKPIGPLPSLKECETLMADLKGTEVPDEVQALGMSCVQVIPNVKA